jgi:nucleoside transporter
MLRSVPARLAMMMFLQYFGMGAWIIPLTRYLPAAPEHGGLQFTATEVGFVYMTLAIGGLVAPFVVGLLADRWFAVEKVIAAAHAVLAVALATAGWWCHSHSGVNANPDAAFGPLVALMGIYSLGCQITLTLTNVISFRNLHDSEGSFGYVRLVGTFGWVVGGMTAGWVLNPMSADPLLLASAGSLVLVGFAFTLPHTPPKGYGRPIREVIGLPALQMLRDPAIIVFAVVLFLGNMLNQFYTLFTAPYLHTLGVRVDLGPLGSWGPEVIMTLAQWCEIGCMAAIPFLLKRYGLKWLMLLGVAGWVLRNVLLYWGNVPLLVAIGLPMHGWSYAFFTMLGALFVDREAPKHLRAGTQALVTFLSSGPAVILGNYLASRIVEAHRVGEATAWNAVWIVPLVGYLFAFVFFAALFKEPPLAGVGSRESGIGTKGTRDVPDS